MSKSFTQLSLDSSAKKQSSAHENVFPLSAQTPTPVQLKDFRLQLLTQIQSTLEIDEVIAIFFRNLKAALPLSGMQYSNRKLMKNTECGQQGRHRCSYQLTIGQNDYGEIVLSRAKRFSEVDMAFIESIMDTLIFSLRNAIKYNEALSSAAIDPLTGIYNRASMPITLHREMERSRRHEDQFISLIMIDIDKFKSINDRYGHLVGDDVLRQVAGIIEQSIRVSDACFRYGGEEFLVCLTNSSLIYAHVVSERIRQAVIDNVYLPNHEHRVSASFGVAHYRDEQKWPELLERADKALYSAKLQGGNTVVASISQSPPHIESV